MSGRSSDPVTYKAEDIYCPSQNESASTCPNPSGQPEVRRSAQEQQSAAPSSLSHLAARCAEESVWARAASLRLPSTQTPCLWAALVQPTGGMVTM